MISINCKYCQTSVKLYNLSSDSTFYHCNKCRLSIKNKNNGTSITKCFYTTFNGVNYHVSVEDDIVILCRTIEGDIIYKHIGKIDLTPENVEKKVKMWITMI